MKVSALAAVVVAIGSSIANAQPSAPVVTKTDVIYGRVEGSALLANIAYPDGPSLKPAIISVHGGRWRAGNRAGQEASRGGATAAAHVMASNAQPFVSIRAAQRVMREPMMTVRPSRRAIQTTNQRPREAAHPGCATGRITTAVP